MAEEAEGQDTGAEAVAGGADPAAVALALGGASRGKADAFLDNQNALIADQRHHLHRQLVQVELRIWEQRMGLMLRIAAGFVGLVIAAGLALMIWDAAHADGTVVESFAVPPDLAARGLTGEVVAGALLDKLGVVEAPPANSVSGAQTISAGSADDVKVEIPETGISIGELYRFLRKWLGHETMVGGDVVHTADGLAVTVRINGKDGASYAGPEAGLDALIQKAAEHVYGMTSPSGYAAYLLNVQRVQEARAILERITSDPASDPHTKASAWNALGILYRGTRGDERTAGLMYRRAGEADPSFPQSYFNLVVVEQEQGHAEAAFLLLPKAINVFEHNHEGFTQRARAEIRARLHAQVAELGGDYAGAIAEMKPAEARSAGSRQYSYILRAARALAYLHDGGAGAWLAQQPMPRLIPLVAVNRLMMLFEIEAALEHWPAVITMEAATEKAMAQADGTADINFYSAVSLRPWLALAKAKTGDNAGAQAVIVTTPGDCYDCVRLRGVIASQARAWGRADWWFARAVQQGPSLPFAETDWGQSLLMRGQPDAAIDKFKLANQKSPHFADPLEGWGEALMAKNQSHLALAKFAEAEKYAPNWGRLHLKWGEALVYAGKKDEAKAEFARAAALDLTPSEKAELAAQSPHV